MGRKRIDRCDGCGSEQVIGTPLEGMSRESPQALCRFCMVASHPWKQNSAAPLTFEDLAKMLNVMAEILKPAPSGKGET